MFSRFETQNGVIYIRSIDIRFIEDGEGACRLMWEPVQGDPLSRTIQGTADENMARLRQEESEALQAAERLRQRQANGYPAQPVMRGRK